MHEPQVLAAVEDHSLKVPALGPLGRLLLQLSKGLALCGGLIFVVLVIMSIVSITGRKLFAAPVPGDIEIMQMTSAFACSCFFAYCHLNGGDVKVDFFTARSGPVINHRLDALGSLLLGICGAALAWRSGVGALSVREAGETSMILGWPMWLAQLLMCPGLVLLAAAGFYMTARHLFLAAWFAREVRA